jgi:hypothetical protein
MPLIPSALSAVIKTKFDTAAPVADYPGAEAVRQDMCDKLADALITYLVANNLVEVVTPMGAGIGSFS